MRSRWLEVRRKPRRTWATSDGADCSRTTSAGSAAVVKQTSIRTGNFLVVVSGSPPLVVIAEAAARLAPRARATSENTALDAGRVPDGAEGPGVCAGWC